jgi:hypothetical protein
MPGRLIARWLATVAGPYFWADLEVQIEGKDGWGKNLPTWRIVKHPFCDWFLGGRPLTGFHFWAFGFVFFIYHWALLWIPRVTWAAECEILGNIAFFWILEDLFWFLVNPHYGWRRYDPKNIKWHPRWFLGLPADHWGILLLGILLLGFAFWKA